MPRGSQAAASDETCGQPRDDDQRKKREGRLASPFSKYRSLQGPQPKQEIYFLPFFLAFFLALPLAFAFLLAAIVVLPSFVRVKLHSLLQG